jgi:sortase A
VRDTPRAPDFDMNKIVRGAVWAITIVAELVFIGTLVHALWYAPEDGVPVAGEQTARELPPSEAPDRLLIPALNIDANVQQTGVNSKGNMGVPTNFTDVAWYKLGTVPGQLGSAVIDGHVDNGLALAGVFKHLSDIKVGDDVYIKTKTGRSLHFVVQDIVIYPYKDVPLDKLFTRSDDAHLNLVTCDGAWVKNEKTYDQRLVVYTVLKDSTNG